MSASKKQHMLANMHHTCSCPVRQVSFDWATTKIIDADFENSGEPHLEDGRTLWVVSKCLNCCGTILHGSSFTDYRTIGEKLLSDAIEKANLWIIGNCEYLRLKINSATKRYEFKEALQIIWKKYQ